MMEDGPSKTFNAMFIFLKRYWERGGKSSDDIAVLLGSLERGADGFPTDIALWHDWILAYGEARSDSELR